MSTQFSVAELLANHDLAILDNEPDVHAALQDDLTIAYTNNAWDSFATDNGGNPRLWSEGFNYMAVVPATLRPFYLDLFDNARRTNAPTGHIYECSSQKLERHFQMQVYPLPKGGFLVSHALVQDRIHPGPICAALESLYTSPEMPSIVVCMHCRRTKRSGTGHWDWVPAYVADQPKSTSHGLCEPCMAHYYP